MSKKKRFGVPQALSTGLSETVSIAENYENHYRNAVIPLTRIEPDPDNPRRLLLTREDLISGPSEKDPDFAKKNQEFESLSALASSIESEGVIHPIIVYKRGEKYRIVAGERRFLASIIAHRDEIDARVFHEKPKGFQLRLVQWLENNAREDLTLDKRFLNIQQLIQAYSLEHGPKRLTIALMTEITKLAKSQAASYLTLFNAADDIQKAVLSGQITNLDKAVSISSIEDSEQRAEAIQACAEGASLKVLREQVKTAPVPQSPISAPAKKSRGRAPTKVAFGQTTNLQVGRLIIESLLDNPVLQPYQKDFVLTEEMEHADMTKMMKALLSILEAELV